MEGVGMGTVLLSEKLGLFVCFPLLLQPLLVSHFWNICDCSVNIKLQEGCLHLHLSSPMVCRDRSLTYTVATALSCSSNIEFRTRIMYYTKASCISAKRLPWTCFLRAQ